MSDAREKIAEVLSRAPGEKPPVRDKLGGASPHASRYEIVWQDPAAGTSVRIGIKHFLGKTTFDHSGVSRF